MRVPGKITIESGVPVSELIRYFQSIAVIQDHRRFTGQGWAIEVISSKEVQMGALTLPRTVLLFQGSPETVKALVDEFRMRFLSAGG